jgi:hypothetical protein
MRPDVAAMLKRQADWQRARRSLPWAEKLRQSVSMRRAKESLRQGAALRTMTPRAR